MTEAARLNILRTESSLRPLLERNFDFSPRPAQAKSSLFHLADDASFELIGSDASGGEFVLCASGQLPRRPLLFVSSEGQAGVIGRNLEEGLSTIIAIPFWMDCLKFSGGGQLVEMRRVIPLSEAEMLEDSPRFDSSRQVLKTRLELQPLIDPVQTLHKAVTELSPLFPAYGSDGSQFRTLFNTFTVMSNPQWRRKLSNSE
jgi:hypothetical protein